MLSLMKTYLAVLSRTMLAGALLIGLWGCFPQEEDVTPPPEPLPSPSLEEAVYHEGVGAWIVPQKDPYALENFQQARDNLLAVGVLARSGGSSGTRALEATHYALKIFPRNEDEQWEIELMDDVEVSYIPFDYAGLTEQQAQELESAASRASERPVFTDTSPHVVTYDEVQQTIDEGAEERVSHTMPILYAVWPVGKPLPEDKDYEMDYEVFLPFGEAQSRGTATLSGTDLRLLEDEAIRLALGDSASPATAATRSDEVVLSGEFETWEVLRELWIPIPRIKVKFHLGSNIVETDADENGYFSITAGSIPADASWDIVFQSPQWKITRENSTIPKNFFQGDVYQNTFWSDTTTHIRTTVQAVDATIINTLNYFYYVNHNITKWEIPGGIRIIAHNETNPNYNGLFTYTSSGSCYITVYRNNTIDRNRLMGTVFHEMGHFVHFKERGDFTRMKNVDRFLQESFASYVGWSLTEKFYEDLGYTPSRDISGQGRQSWRQTMTGASGWYSPLFVDLDDDFNQAVQYASTYNQDKIKGSYSATIMRIARESTDWASCKSLLREDRSLAGEDLDTFLAPYDYWFSH